MVSVPFVIGGPGIAQVNTTPYAYEGTDIVYHGPDPVALVASAGPLIPLVPDITPVSTPGHIRGRQRKYRAKHKDRLLEADTPQELARQINALANEDGEDEITILVESPQLKRSNIPADTELDFIPTDDDDELAMLILLSQVL